MGRIIRDKAGFRIKHPLSDEQRNLITEIIESGMNLSKREHYVLPAVLTAGTYHDNHKYHLTNVRKRWIEFKKLK